LTSVPSKLKNTSFNPEKYVIGLKYCIRGQSWGIPEISGHEKDAFEKAKSFFFSKKRSSLK
jgi:hypothetical protein